MKDIPSLPERIQGDTNGDLMRVLRAMRENLRGLSVGSDRALRQSDAATLAAGSVTVVPGGSGGTGSGGSYTPDLTPPPTPTALTVLAGFSQVIITWSGIGYTQGHGHKRAIVYGVKKSPGDATMPTFGDAQKLGEAFNALTIFSLPSEPYTRWHVWLTFESVDGVESTSPAGGTNGVQATTGLDVSNVLTTLNSKITRSQLYSDIGTPIDLITAPATTVNSVSYKVEQERLRAVGQETTLAASISTVQGNVDTVSAAVSTEASARATADGYLGAQYTVRVALTQGGRTVVGGFGISGTSAGGAGATIDFGIRADKFWIGAPSGTPGVADIAPFMVLTNDTVENGVTIPKGVYMDAAYIRNLGALYARIGNLVADSVATASLSAAQLTAGTGVIGGPLKSANYASGTAGWILQPSGVFEASNAVIRGTVYAANGSFDGLVTIRDPGGAILFQSGGYLDYSRIIASAGWLNSNITLTGGSGTVQINGAGGGSVGGIVMPGNPITAANISTYMAAAALGNAYIGKHIASDDFNGTVDSSGNITNDGTVGWAIGKAGRAVFNTGVFRGNISGATMTASTFSGGQTAWNTGTGFWMGFDGGVPKFSIGNPAGSYVIWNGSQLLFDTFTASISGGNISVSVADGNRAYGTRSVSVSGGVPPYSYAWFVSNGSVASSYSPTGYFWPSRVWIYGGSTSLSVTVAGNGDGWTNQSRLFCIVKDANGRTTFASVSITAIHAQNTGAAPGGEGGSSP